MDDQAKAERRQRDVAANALVVLLERLGGETTISHDEFQAFQRKYGDITRLGVSAELRTMADGSKDLHLKLVTTAAPATKDAPPA